MRRVRIVLPAVLSLLAWSTAAAQNSECDQYALFPETENVCNAALDGAVVFHPVAGLLVSGGNPVLGSTGTLGGFPHFSITARVNVTKLHTPDLNYDGSGTTVAAGEEITAPAPLVEAALGVFKGLNGGFLSVDLLGSAQLLPTNQIDNLTVDDDARKIGDIALGLGYGARIGVIRGHAIVPSVTVSVMRRDIPTITYGDVSGGDQYSYAVDLHATNLRAVAGYKLAILSVGAGIGWDKYTGDSRVVFENPLTSTVEPPIDKELDQSRTMMFLTGALDLPVFKIAAEVGYQLGKDQNLATTFENNDPSDKRLFAGAGLRFSF